jgi:hypothetical protein
MTRTERLAAFEELTKLTGVKRASVFADELDNTARLLIDHPAASRPWKVLGPAEDLGFWHLESSAPVGLDYYNSRFDYQRFHLCLHESDFERIVQ